MNIFITIGRILFGAGIVGIGELHFFYPGIRPLILPEMTDISAQPAATGYAVGILLTIGGLVIVIGRKFNPVALLMAVVFMALFLFGHLPWSLTGGSFNKYWVDANKMIALSGGFFVVSTINNPIYEGRIMQLISRIAPLGKYLFAIMLYNFAVGHYNNLEGISNIVPKYIPFPQFWTFLGGVTLMGAAISIFTGYKVRLISMLLAINLFGWLLMLHIYYTVLYPEWNEGGNIIGTVTCMCFCGTALILSQTEKDKLP